jgi:hypothetical protein
MFPWDSWYGRGLAVHPMPESGVYPRPQPAGRVPTAAAAPEVFLPASVEEKIKAVVRECYDRWRNTPDCYVYVAVEMERAARAAVDAVAADLIAAGRAEASGEAVS